MQFPQTINREAMEALTFIKKKENLIFYGPIGIGKTHLAIALGLLVCEGNYTVRFYTLIELAIKLNEYYAKGKLERFINDLKKVDLLILDEWGYLPVDLQASRLLFRVIADVYERHSLIITTNIDFSKWSGIFSDTQMAMAMVDRLVHHGHLFRFDGESYRLMHALMTQ